jgi:hypothetical protein
MPLSPETELGFAHLLSGAAAAYGWHPPMALPKPAVQKPPATPQAPDFVSGVLKGIGAPVNSNTTQALRDWIAAEGGSASNPLNTTLGQDNAQGSAIKGYGTVQAGINATVSTLRNGLYNSVIAAFKGSNQDQIRQAVINSPWSGSSHYAGTDYAKGMVHAANPPTPSSGLSANVPGLKALPSAPQATFPGTLPTTMTIPAFNPNPNNLPTRGQAITTDLLRGGGQGLSMSQLLRAVSLPESYPAATPARTVNVGGGPSTTPGVNVAAQAQAGQTPMPNSEFARMVSEMNQVAGHRYNYEWGGGHNPTFAPTTGAGHGSGPGVGYDCSGAISAILHAAGKLAQPLVASQFMTYGQPGPGGRNDLTIYASPDHVFAELNGRFFGTSMSNPGGGAGWFQRAQTAGYTIRHVSLQGAPAVHMTGQGGLVPFRSA